MEQYKEYLESKGYSRKSAISMVKSVTPFLKWLADEGIEQGNESYTDVLAYIKYCTKKGNTRRTINTNLRNIEHYYNYQIETEQTETNPVKRTRVKGERKKLVYDTLETEKLENLYNNFKATTIAGKRNKVILGLMIYQAIRSGELDKLEPKDINLRKGKIFIAGSRRTNERELKLEAHQIIDIQEYMTETRKVLLLLTGKETNKLFTGMGAGEELRNVISKLMKQLKKQDPGIKDYEQIRASVIVNWLKENNLRKVQYMAGHRYVSSTEKYQTNNLDSLKDDINKYHPINDITIKS